MRKIVFQPKLMREVSKKMRRDQASLKERNAFEALVKTYHRVVFFRESLWKLHTEGEWKSLSECIQPYKKEFGLEEWTRLTRSLEKVDKKVLDHRGEFQRLYGAVVKGIIYKSLKSELVALIESFLTELEIPYTLGSITGEVHSVYFKSSRWVGLDDLSPETVQKLEEKIRDAESISERVDLEMGGVREVIKSADIYGQNKEYWESSVELSPSYVPEDIAYRNLLLAGLGPIRTRLRDVEIDRDGSTDVISVSFTDGSDMRRLIRGETIENDYFIKDNPCLSPGMGMQATFSQIIYAFQEGFKKIEMYAGADGMVGYLVWPKFGYDGIVEEDYNRHWHEPSISDYLKRINVGSEVYVSDILSAVDENGDNIGVAWWTKNGEGFDAEFDLSPDSRSMKVFSLYMRKKLDQLGMTLSEFFSMPLPLADTTRIECWEDIIREKAMGERDMMKFLPDIAVALSNARDQRFWEDKYFLDSLRADYPKVRAALMSKRASGSTDPVAEEVWGQIGRERIAQAKKVQALKILAPSDFDGIEEAEKRLGR